MSRIRSILLVDDDQDDRKLFAEVLANIDPAIEVTSAQHGLEAMKILASKALPKPELIILDYNMPMMNGVECLKLIKKLDVGNIPVIIYTTSSSAFHRDQSLFNGAAEYIVKPSRMEVLHTVLTALVDKYLK